MQEFIREINASKELQEELKETKDLNAVEAFLKSHDCGATGEEFAGYIKSQIQNHEGELTDEALSAVSGGQIFITIAGMIEIDDTVPQSKQGPNLPYHPIPIEDE